MKDYNQDYIPGQWGTGPQPAASKEVKPVKRGVSIGFLLSAVCIVAVFAILFTYTMTAETHRKYYSNKLAEQQATIEQLRNEVENRAGYENHLLKTMGGQAK